MKKEQAILRFVFVLIAVSAAAMEGPKNKGEASTITKIEASRMFEEFLPYQPKRFVNTGEKESTQGVASLRGKLVKKQAGRYTIETMDGKKNDVIITKETKFMTKPKIGDWIDIALGPERKAETIKEGRVDNRKDGDNLKSCGFYC